MKLTLKYFFIADVLFLWGLLRLESSCISVNAVLYYSYPQLLSRWPFPPQYFMTLFILPVHTVQ